MIVEREAMFSLLHAKGTDEAGFVIKAASGGVDGEIMSIRENHIYVQDSILDRKMLSPETCYKIGHRFPWILVLQE